MRLLVSMIVFWAGCSLLLGSVGRNWLERSWLSSVQQVFLRDAHAALSLVEAADWSDLGSQNPESTTTWRRVQSSLGLGLLPVSPQQASSPISPAKLESLVTGSRAGAVQLAQEAEWVQWQASAAGIGTVFVDLALDGQLGDVGVLRVSRDLQANPLSWIWWGAWAALNSVALVIGVVAWRRLRQLGNARVRLLRPWFSAMENEPDSAQLLPHVEPQDSDFCLQMDSIADSINQHFSDLRNENERSELVLGNLREGVLAVDDRSQILLANRAFRRLFQLPDSNFLYRPFLEMLRIPAVTKLIQQTLRDHNPAVDEIEFGDEPRHLRVFSRPLPLSEARMGAEDRVGVLVTVRDQTLIKRVDLIKRDFVANASHELKTPLAAIRAYAETLEMGALEDVSAAKGFVKNIVAQADRMDGLVQGMLQLSRVEVGAAVKIKKFDVLEAVGPCIDAAQALARGKGIRVELEQDPNEIWVESDRDGLQTIVSNLLSNAVRYTPEDGTVRSALYVENEALVIEVVDTGIGMRKEDLDRVFERFYRAEKDRSSDTGGTGLGLAIVKHLVSALNGQVTADSELGVGSRFRVELPLKWRSEIETAVR
ncbi:MAG: sensor histidine kinase [Aureliella sp.]